MTIHEMALRYAELGYSVIPLAPKAKLPLLSSWAPYQERRATPEEIDGWFEQWPSANIAIVCGAVSGGLVVIDVDGAGNPWPGTTGELPAAAVSLTGGGGRQFFMRIPEGTDLGNSVGNLAARVDIRANGGYVVAPPSIHPLTNQEYRWAIPLTCPAPELPLIPEWVLAILRRNRDTQTRGEATPEDKAGAFAQLLAGVDEGARNDAAARLAGHYFGKGLERTEVDVILRDWNAKNRPPMADKELVAVIESIGKRELLKREGAIPASDAEVTDDQRQVWLEEVSEEIGIPITAAYRIEGDEPQFEMHAADQKVVIPLDKLQSAAEFSKAMMRIANRLPAVNRKKYAQIVNKLLASAKRIYGAEDTTLRGQVSGWLEAYLEVRPPTEPGEGLTFDAPVRMDGGVWISARKFYQYCRRQFDYRDDARRFSQDLTRFGFMFKRQWIRLKTGGPRQQVRMYQVPAGFVVSRKNEESET